MPPSDAGDDQWRVRRRRARDRRDVRSAHLRAVEPLRRADQQARPHHGLRRAAGPAGACGTRHHTRNPARRPRVLRRRGPRQRPGNTCGCRRQGRRGNLRNRTPHCRRSTAGGALAQALHPPPRRPETLRQGEWDEGFACFDSEDYGIGFRAFLDKKKPEFKGK